MKHGRFVAGSHLCWFSKNPDYKQMSVNEVLEKNPEYIIWCEKNLHYIRFATGLSNRIKKAKQFLQSKNNNHHE